MIKKSHNILVLKKVTSNIWKETCIHDLVNIYIVVSLEHPDDKASVVNELNTVQEEANTWANDDPSINMYICVTRPLWVSMFFFFSWGDA